MVRKTNFVKLYKIMYKLTAIYNRRALSHVVRNINQYSDSQVFELMHAVNTHVDVQKLMNPKMSSTQMRKIRLDQEFGKQLCNVNYDGQVNDKIMNMAR